MRSRISQRVAVLAVTAMFVTLAPASGADEPLVLVRDGVANSLIVLGSEAPTPAYSAKPAALFLQHYLTKISGAEIPPWDESKVTSDNSRGKVLILVGDGKKVRELGLTREGLAPEGFLLKTIGGHLVILGGDEHTRQGTKFGVVALLERYLGVRWILPFDTGEIVPQRRTISLDAIEFRDQPRFLVRNMRNLFDNSGLWEAARPFMGDEQQHGKLYARGGDWYGTQRLAFGVGINGAHSDDGMFTAHGKTHPEWFAQQPDGRRFVPERYQGNAKLCLSNPALVRYRANEALAELKQNPNLDSIALSPSDGSDWGFCMCDACKAWDDPRGEKLRFRPTYDDPAFEYVSLSDRYARYYSAVAEQVCQSYPHVRIVGMAYGNYTAAPLKTKVHPNVVILYVGAGSWQLDRDRAATRNDLVGWGKAGAQLAWRPNWLAHNAWILIYPHALAEDMRDFYRAGMRFADYDTCVNDWGANGINFYVLAKLLWNPEQNVDEIIDDYLRHGFGPAAEPMRRYFALLEATTSKMTAETDPEIFWYYEIPRFWTSTVFQDAHASLKAADSAAAGSPEVDMIRRRIDLCRQALEWQQIRLELSQSIKSLRDKTGDRATCDALLAKRSQWVKQHLYSEAMPVPYILYQDFRYRGYYEP